MSSDLALQLLIEMLWVGLQLSAPFLALVLLVGLLISIVQVATQIQEVSLTFIPKIIAVMASLATFGPWMLRRLVEFATAAIGNIPGYF